MHLLFNLPFSVNLYGEFDLDFDLDILALGVNWVVVGVESGASKAWPEFTWLAEVAEETPISWLWPFSSNWIVSDSLKLLFCSSLGTLSSNSIWAKPLCLPAILANKTEDLLKQASSSLVTWSVRLSGWGRSYVNDRCMNTPKFHRLDAIIMDNHGRAVVGA
jgi:hypothetical protein